MTSARKKCRQPMLSWRGCQTLPGWVALMGRRKNDLNFLIRISETLSPTGIRLAKGPGGIGLLIAGRGVSIESP